MNASYLYSKAYRFSALKVVGESRIHNKIMRLPLVEQVL